MDKIIKPRTSGQNGIVVSASSAYTAGDCVGGKLVGRAMLLVDASGLIHSLALIDKANQKQAMELLVFDDDPSSATITDNDPFQFGGDEGKLVTRIPIAASDYVTIDSIGIARVTGIGSVVRAKNSSGNNAEANLYFALVTTGTPTYADTADIILALGILQQ